MNIPADVVALSAVVYNDPETVEMNLTPVHRADVIDSSPGCNTPNEYLSTSAHKLKSGLESPQFDTSWEDDNIQSGWGIYFLILISFILMINDIAKYTKWESCLNIKLDLPGNNDYDFVQIICSSKTIIGRRGQPLYDVNTLQW